MIILIKLFLNSKLDLIRNVKFVKHLFRIQIQKCGKLSLWNQVKSRMEACYSELVLVNLKGLCIRIWNRMDRNITWTIQILWPLVTLFWSGLASWCSNKNSFQYQWQRECRWPRLKSTLQLLSKCWRVVPISCMWLVDRQPY
jgi:hypothetical protein